MPPSPRPSPDIAAHYRARLAARQAALAARDRVHAWLSYSRLAVIGAFVAGLVYFGPIVRPWWLAPAGAFAVLAWFHARALSARDRAGAAVAFYERGVARLEGVWAGRGDDGARYRQASHLYADDLDVFGRGSMFELVGTARTHAGQDTIAAWLASPAAPGEIRARQEAVRELMPQLDLREAFAVLGDSAGIGVDAARLRAWAQQPAVMPAGPMRAILLAASAGVVFVAIWWAVTGWIPWWGLAFPLVEAAIAAIVARRVVSALRGLDATTRDLALLGGALRTVEALEVRAPALVRVREAIAGEPASRAIARLDQLTALLNSQRNIIFVLPAALVAWGIHCAWAIDRWRTAHGTRVPAWLDALGEFEALLALATFAAEHPGYAWPEIVEAPAMLEAIDLAHPLLGADAVGNDIAIGGSAPHVFVVSGSNMSGKSTWLRTIGCNVVLAQAGAPVRAARLRLSPLAVGASIRVLDSLQDGRSRFFSEIVRLKALVDLAQASPGQMLFLLDEILSGTNSHDRAEGADGLLIAFVRLGAVGLATTHDLALGAIADRLGARGVNVHFEDTIRDGVLAFDYRLRPGVVRTSNALALMKMVGL